MGAKRDIDTVMADAFLSSFVHRLAGDPERSPSQERLVSAACAKPTKRSLSLIAARDPVPSGELSGLISRARGVTATYLRALAGESLARPEITGLATHLNADALAPLLTHPACDPQVYRELVAARLDLAEISVRLAGRSDAHLRAALAGHAAVWEKRNLIRALPDSATRITDALVDDDLATFAAALVWTDGLDDTARTELVRRAAALANTGVILHGCRSAEHSLETLRLALEWAQVPAKRLRAELGFDAWRARRFTTVVGSVLHATGMSRPATIASRAPSLDHDTAVSLADALPWEESLLNHPGVDVTLLAQRWSHHAPRTEIERSWMAYRLLDAVRNVDRRRVLLIPRMVELYAPVRRRADTVASIGHLAAELASDPVLLDEVNDVYRERDAVCGTAEWEINRGVLARMLDEVITTDAEGNFVTRASALEWLGRDQIVLDDALYQGLRAATANAAAMERFFTTQLGMVRAADGRFRARRELAEFFAATAVHGDAVQEIAVTLLDGWVGGLDELLGTAVMLQHG